MPLCYGVASRLKWPLEPAPRQLAHERGAPVTGLDATPAFVDEARRRVPASHFVAGEMEELPFPDGAFELVCSFNSFQYAADVPAALREARRMLAGGSRLVAAIWGNPADCEAASYLRAVGSLLPPPPPGAPGPFPSPKTTCSKSCWPRLAW